MSRLRFRLVLVFAALIVLGRAGLAAELAYGAWVRFKARELERSILVSHKSPQFCGTHFTRFGDNSPSLSPSLVADVSQGLRRALGWPSKLDAGGSGRMSPPPAHAYYWISFNFERRDSWAEFSHDFIWSPRELRFIHAGNSGCCYCPHKRCRWRWSPHTMVGPDHISKD